VEGCASEWSERSVCAEASPQQLSPRWLIDGLAACQCLQVWLLHLYVQQAQRVQPLAPVGRNPGGTAERGGWGWGGRGGEGKRGKELDSTRDTRQLRWEHP
jgi:hypothetical protein